MRFRWRAARIVCARSADMVGCRGWACGPGLRLEVQTSEPEPSSSALWNLNIFIWVSLRNGNVDYKGFDKYKLEILHQLVSQLGWVNRHCWWVPFYDSGAARTLFGKRHRDQTNIITMFPWHMLGNSPSQSTREDAVAGQTPQPALRQNLISILLCASNESKLSNASSATKATRMKNHQAIDTVLLIRYIYASDVPKQFLIHI